MEWISVKDRLPEKDHQVVITDGNNIEVANIANSGEDFYWCGCCSWLDGSPTHWAEINLPEKLENYGK